MTQEDASPRDEEAVLIALAAGKQHARRLEANGCRLLNLTSKAESPAKAQTIPRLVLLSASTLDGDSTAAVHHLQTARRRWPLADALVLAPDASPQLVRALRSGHESGLCLRGSR